MATSAPLRPQQERSIATRRRLLDAAVDELLEHGYAKLTSGGVATRAGVSRGAQQNHFPHRQTLVTEAVRHLAQRHVEELHEAIARPPRGRARTRTTLDIMFAQYGGPLFAAFVELSLAARDDADLRMAIADEERAVSRAAAALAPAIFGAEAASASGFAERWSTAVSAVRGLALLKLLGHPSESVERQWIATRRHLVGLLGQG